ncbi:bone marrow proteoglycan-like [Pelodiscus sinensis]|uniref:bone marrow proteoglycan-like n=1 Tax=Pelodiscus sinensis TaxID=13735 RepID=UPI003F6A6CE9
MKLSLVLALALLGAVSAHQLDAGALEQEIPDEEGEEESGEPETPCPTESEIVRMVVPGTGGRTYRYVLVRSCQTFRRAQRQCSRCYHGRLASIHSRAVNHHLQCTVRARTKRSDVWIGAYASRRSNCVRAHWIDRSTWNYSNWARGYPNSRWTRCVSMCTATGLWRCLSCRTRLPYVCEY